MPKTTGDTLVIWFKQLRVFHYIKSLFCLAPLLMSGNLFDINAWCLVIPALIAFSLISSVGYISNDLINLREDRQHPRKKNRPLAHGDISIKQAVIVALLVLITGVSISYSFYGFENPTLLLIAYFFLTISYSLFFRKLAILDVLIISIGFVMRVVTGAYAINVVPTIWLIVCTYGLSLTVAFGKRKGEWNLIQKNQSIGIGDTRPALKAYTSSGLDQLIGLSALMTIISYCGFCLYGREDPLFVITIIPVALSMMSYLRETVKSTSVETPEKLLVRSPSILFYLCLWLLMICYLG